MKLGRNVIAIFIAIAALIPFAGRWDDAWAAESNKAAEAKVAKNPEAPACDRSQFHLVVDVGHTEEVYGALSARNAVEYDFNLRQAKEIEKSLVDDGFTKTTLLVTHGPARPSLVKRVASANRLLPHLFLSIHHDSVPDQFLENWEYEGRPSHFSDRFKGYSLFVSKDNPNLRASLQFGRLIGLRLKESGVPFASQYTQPFMGHKRRELVDAEAGVYRYDALQVLKNTRMPAVLLEAGSIINRDEELAMNSPERRAIITAAVKSAVESFCDSEWPKPKATRSVSTAKTSKTAVVKPAQ
jgi:N-acetylmuramoyl-L-alanine amidase